MNCFAVEIYANLVSTDRHAVRQNTLGSRSLRLQLPRAHLAWSEGFYMPMPRILKVMPEFWSDPRLENLKELLKSSDKAISRSIRWFSMACDHYAANEIVPVEKFKSIGCPELETVGFAIRIQGGYRAAGDHDHFKWLKSKMENGSKGGKAKSESLANSSDAVATPELALANASLERRTKNEERKSPLGIPPHGGTTPKTGEDTSSVVPITQKRPTRGQIKTWVDDDDLAEVFSNLCDCAQYRAIFDREKDRKNIYEAMARYSLSLADMKEITFDFKNWTDGHKVKSPRGTLNTFFKKHVEFKSTKKRRPDARSLPQFMPEPEDAFPPEEKNHA